MTKNYLLGQFSDQQLSTMYACLGGMKEAALKIIDLREEDESANVSTFISKINAESQQLDSLMNTVFTDWFSEEQGTFPFHFDAARNEFANVIQFIQRKASRESAYQNGMGHMIILESYCR